MKRFDIKKYLTIFSEFFEKLSSKPRIGGFQITGSSVQYFIFNKDRGSVRHSLTLPPGIIVSGKLQDVDKFTEIVTELRKKITVNDWEKQPKVIVCMPSEVSYVQNFEIPNVGSEEVEQTIELNLKSISPVSVERAYMGWQLIDKTEDKYEILGAFAEQGVVDNYRNALKIAGFHPIIFEFPSLALSWLINRTVGIKDKPFLFISVSGDGIDIFLLKKGNIHFDYFRSWQSIQGSSDKISQSAFENVLVEEIGKVINFTTGKFNEKPGSIFFVAPDLEDKVDKIIKDHFNVELHSFLINNPVGPSWYTVIGSAIRGSWDRENDKFISLGTGRVELAYFRDQILDFVALWRNVFSFTILTFLIFFTGSAIIINIQPGPLEDRLGVFTPKAQQDYQYLASKAGEFNELVQSVSRVVNSGAPTLSFLGIISDLGQEYDILLDSVNIVSGEGISISARAPDYSTVIDFKNFLVDHSNFSDVSLPFSQIVTVEGNYVGFNMSFNYSNNPIED